MSSPELVNGPPIEAAAPSPITTAVSHAPAADKALDTSVADPGNTSGTTPDKLERGFALWDQLLELEKQPGIQALMAQLEASKTQAKAGPYWFPPFLEFLFSSADFRSLTLTGAGFMVGDYKFCGSPRDQGDVDAALVELRPLSSSDLTRAAENGMNIKDIEAALSPK